MKNRNHSDEVSTPAYVGSAPAKINLFLRIVRRREDGYHDIETLFQKIDLCDRMVFVRTREGFALECVTEMPDAAMTPEGMERNLVTRAYRLLAGVTSSSQVGGVRVELEKNIPAGGGLGGGSSDAATTLLALNELLELHLSEEELHALAARLGSDVPFFLGPPAAVGTGRGEILVPVAQPSRFWAILALPALHVSTPQVYSQYNPACPASKGDLDGLLQALQRQDLSATLALLYNEMEQLAFSIEPQLGRLCERLEAIAERPVRMSGSGSTLFTLAATEHEAKALAEEWRERESIRTTAVPFIIQAKK